MEDGHLKTFTKALVAICVRNGYLEELHAGTRPFTETGDYSDVKVVTPHGEIPWNEVSRIDDAEMKKLIKGIVNGIYTVLLHEHDPQYIRAFLSLASGYTARWDEPELVPALAGRGGPSR